MLEIEKPQPTIESLAIREKTRSLDPKKPRLKYVQRWDILYTSTSRLPVLSRFIPLSDDRIYARRIPLFSIIALSSLFLFPLFKVESPLHPPLPPSPSPRDAHYRNVSVTAVKNVDSRYHRHCPVDAKCLLAGIPIVDFGCEGDVATHARRLYRVRVYSSIARIRPVRLDLSKSFYDMVIRTLSRYYEGVSTYFFMFYLWRLFLFYINWYLYETAEWLQNIFENIDIYLLY